MTGTCHMTGGVHHRCDSTPEEVRVRYNGREPASYYRWCRAAQAEVGKLAADNGVAVTIQPDDGEHERMGGWAQ